MSPGDSLWTVNRSDLGCCRVTNRWTLGTSAEVPRVTLTVGDPLPATSVTNVLPRNNQRALNDG